MLVKYQTHTEPHPVELSKMDGLDPSFSTSPDEEVLWSSNEKTGKLGLVKFCN